MALSWIATQRDILQHGNARLTVVTIGDVAAETPGLSGHLASDTSVTHCRAKSADVISSFRQSAPCVLVADVSLVANLNLAKLRTATDSFKTLIVVDDDDPKVCQRLLRMGFDGAIERSAPAAIFRRALNAVAEGELWASRKSVSGLIREFLSDASPTKLTTRQQEIFDLLAKGHKNREIADALFVSRDTIRWHLRSIYAKLGVPDRKRAIESAFDEDTAARIKPHAPMGVRKSPRRACS